MMSESDAIGISEIHSMIAAGRFNDALSTAQLRSLARAVQAMREEGLHITPKAGVDFKGLPLTQVIGPYFELGCRTLRDRGDTASPKIARAVDVLHALLTFLQYRARIKAHDFVMADENALAEAMWIAASWSQADVLLATAARGDFDLAFEMRDLKIKNSQGGKKSSQSQSKWHVKAFVHWHFLKAQHKNAKLTWLDAMTAEHINSLNIAKRDGSVNVKADAVRRARRRDSELFQSIGSKYQRH